MIWWLFKFISSHTFEVLVGICILFIIICGVYHLLSGKKGTYSSQFYYPFPDITNDLKKPIIKQRSSGRGGGGDSKGEIECRRVLQKIFRKPFNKIRPGFLSNTVTGGHNLEIDCYDDGLKLGVEYSGVQHYKYTPFFHKNNEAFINQKYRDEMKRRQCLDNGVTLIEVPYTVKINEIESYLTKELAKHRYLK